MKFLILVATLILSLAIEIERRRTKPPASGSASRHQQQTNLRRFRETKAYRALVRIFEFALVLSAIGQGLVAFWGPFWPTRPKIEFHDTIDASSFVLPFKITNSSVTFPMNLQINCGVDLFYFMDADRKTGLLRDAMFNPGPIRIDRNSMNNYPCRASDYVRIRENGSLIAGFDDGQNLATRPGAFRAPLTVLKMCLRMGGYYKIARFSVPFHTDIFQWPATPGGHQWIEGPVTPDFANEAWVPPNTSIGGAWGLRALMNADKTGYAPSALQCTRR